MNKKGGWQQFLNLLQKSQNTKQLNELCEFMFTYEEREQLAKRVLLTKALLEGEQSQREIAADLQVSIAKITRGSNSLKQINHDLHEYLLNELVK